MFNNSFGSEFGRLDHACRINAIDIRNHVTIAVIVIVADNATDVFVTLDNVNGECVRQFKVSFYAADQAADILCTLDFSGSPDIGNTICNTVTNQAPYGPFTLNIAV